MSGPPPPPPPPPPATLTSLNLAPLTYEMPGENPEDPPSTETYAIRARIGVRPEPGEEIAYVTLYRKAVNAPEEYVADMSWYASSPLPLDDMEYYEGYDYGYYAPSAGTKWDYHVKVFVMKYVTQKSGNVTYP